jgi:hypothetical protein
MIVGTEEKSLGTRSGTDSTSTFGLVNSANAKQKWLVNSASTKTKAVSIENNSTSSRQQASLCVTANVVKHMREFDFWTETYDKVQCQQFPKNFLEFQFFAVSAAGSSEAKILFVVFYLPKYNEQIIVVAFQKEKKKMGSELACSVQTLKSI